MRLRLRLTRPTRIVTGWRNEPVNPLVAHVLLGCVKGGSDAWSLAFQLLLRKRTAGFDSTLDFLADL